jgi:undecaprenyl pyrophosphate phosphatase UppP
MILNVKTRVSHCQDMLIQKFLAGIANMAAFSREVNRDDFMGFKQHRLVIGIFFGLTTTITNLGSFE